MIDLHCHILPAIDDGPRDVETSVAMAGMAAADGITHIVATPHFRYGERPAAEEIRNALGVLDDAVKKAGKKMRLLAGADIRLTYELLAGIEKRDLPTINGSRYFLLELPDFIPPNLGGFFRRAALSGFVPVITHPERNYSLLSFPQKVRELRDAGVLFQLTAMSITGGFGGRIRSFAHMMLRRGLADFVASDAHDIADRTPVLSDAYRDVSRMCDRHNADRMFYHNPAAVIEDRDMPGQENAGCGKRVNRK